jgi:uncharacterized membrane protein YdbT with pleckstrin-like domain
MGLEVVIGYHHRSMKYDPSLLSDGESIVTQFRPHYRMLLVPMGWFILVLIALGLLIAIGDIWWYTNDILLLIVLIAFVLLVLWPIIKWWFTLYVLTSERLISRQGVISRSGVEIPLENINNVLFHQSVIERVLKSGDLMIESAGQSGQVRFDNVWRPDEFQALLYRTREDRARALSEQSRPGPEDPTEQLERLARLHRQGSITDEEYERSKQALLDDL